MKREILGMLPTFSSKPGEGKIGAHHTLPLRELWSTLSVAQYNPYLLCKWVMGANFNPLEDQAVKKGWERGNFYIPEHDAKIELGYVKFPNIGELSLDGKKVIQPGDNVVDITDTIHAHRLLEETYVIHQGFLTLMADIPEDGVRRLEGVEEIPDRYVLSGEVIELANFPGKRWSYTVPPNQYHMITKVSPGTELLLIKTPSEYYRDEEHWSDKRLHPAENG
jgi:hypothetical protein